MEIFYREQAEIGALNTWTCAVMRFKAEKNKKRQGFPCLF